MEEKSKETKISWREIPYELLLCYIKKAVLICGLLLCDLWFTLTSRRYAPGIILFVAIMVYLFTAIYSYCSLLKGKMYVFEGLCTNLDLPCWNLDLPLLLKKKSVLKIYGNSEVSIKVDSVTIKAPVYHRFSGKENSIIRIYTLDHGIYHNEENSFYISSPILVHVVKSD